MRLCYNEHHSNQPQEEGIMDVLFKVGRALVALIATILVAGCGSTSSTRITPEGVEYSCSSASLLGGPSCPVPSRARAVAPPAPAQVQLRRVEVIRSQESHGHHHEHEGGHAGPGPGPVPGCGPKSPYGDCYRYQKVR